MELAHTITGSGPTLVLIHGLVHRQHAWDAVVPTLAEHRRVITVDLPGHGDSPAVPADVDDLPGFVIATLEAFLASVAPADGTIHVAGNSLGGWAALELGARGAARSATAISPAGFFTGRRDRARAISIFRGLRVAARPLAGRADSLMGSAIVRTVSQGVFFAKPWRVPASAAAIDLRSLTENELVDRLDGELAFSAPANPDTRFTVLWGRRDLVLPVYESRLVASAFPTAELIVAPGLGHVPMSDNPGLVASVLLAGSLG